MTQDTAARTSPENLPEREQQRLSAAIVDACPAAICAKDTQGRYLLVNRQWETSHHANRDQVIGKTDRELAEALPELARGGNSQESLTFPIAGPSGTAGATCAMEMRQGEHYYQTLVENTTDVVAVLEAEGSVRFVSPAITRILGYAPEERVGKSIDELIHPDDLPGVKNVLAEILRGSRWVTTVKYRSQHRDGSWRLFEASARNLLHDPAIRGLVITSRDITQHDRAEEMLRQKEADLRASRAQLQALAARLLTSEEETRKAIARDLHDDWNQKLAFLAVEADLLAQHLSGPPEVLERLRSLRSRAVELSENVRQMAHRLHPVVLDDLGLETAMRLHCAEFSRLAGMPVEFSCHGLPESLPAEVSLCLYRITQEVFANITRHSKTKKAAVTLTGTPGEVHLVITDWGIGFNPKKVKGKGLGIASMEERVRLVNGRVLIKSAPGQGTQIEVLVPLREKSDEAGSSDTGR